LSEAYEPPVPIVLPGIGPVQRATRLARTMAVATRDLGPFLAARAARRDVPNTDLARGLRRMFTDLSGTYVKLGQLIGSAPGVFGEDFASEFRGFMDRGPAVGFTQVRRLVEKGVGAPIEEVFNELERKPIAAASIAVVHRGVLHDGSQVAVKVLRPGIERLVAGDLEAMRPLFHFLARQGLPAALPLERLVFGFRDQLAEELDLRNEMRAMAHFRRVFAEVGLTKIVIPQVHEELSSRRVLVMELLHGVPIDDPEQLGEAVDPGELIEDLVRAWLLTALRDGVFHGDVHAGNLMLLRDGRLGLIDWGIVGRLDPDTHRFFRRIIEGSLGDESAWLEIVTEIRQMVQAGQTDGERRGPPFTDEELAKLLQAQIQPMMTRPFGEVGLSTIFLTRERAGEVLGRQLEPRRGRPDLRARRRIARRIIDDGRLDSDWFRSNFLLAKQLLYVEGYGRRYLKDSAILSDREFLSRVLAQS
jgi:predicted unusual protein kinase regulating ubiquinone biosynthesis (AarF/ABC1/UbiB family)